MIAQFHPTSNNIFFTIEKNKIEDICKLIYKKLNELNSNIIFYYYIKYKCGEHNIYIDINQSMINFNQYYKNNIGLINQNVDKIIKFVINEFPFYYKQVSLNSHFYSLLSVSEDNYLNIFNVTRENAIIFGDNILQAIDITISELFSEGSATKKDILIYNIKSKELWNSEFRMLMKNANILNKQFNMYKNNITQFFTDGCSIDDYVYMKLV